jgi:hypothetical protein
MEKKHTIINSHATDYTAIVYISSDSENVNYFIAAFNVGKRTDILLISCIIALIWTAAVEAGFDRRLLNYVFVMLSSDSDSASAVERTLWQLMLPSTIQLDEMKWGATRDLRVYARSCMDNDCGVCS